MPKESATQAQAIAPTPETEIWPRPDFLDKALRLLAELDSLARAEEELARRVAEFQRRADARGLTIQILIGKDAAQKLSDAQSAAQRATLEKRDELRQFLTRERAIFYTLKTTEWARHYQETTARFSRAKQSVPDLLDGLYGLLGMKDAVEQEERGITEWNRMVRRFNRSIPKQNVHGIPRAAGIDFGESSRATVEGLFLQDAELRELCRGILTAEGAQRLAAQLLEFKIEEEEDKASGQF